MWQRFSNNNNNNNRTHLRDPEGSPGNVQKLSLETEGPGRGSSLAESETQRGWRRRLPSAALPRVHQSQNHRDRRLEKEKGSVCACVCGGVGAAGCVVAEGHPPSDALRSGWDESPGQVAFQLALVFEGCRGKGSSGQR